MLKKTFIVVPLMAIVWLFLAHHSEMQNPWAAEKPALYQENVLPNETDIFEKIGARIEALQQKAAKNGISRHAVHAKNHGCLKGQFVIDANRPKETQSGVFKETRTFNVWTRFSNGAAEIRPDQAPDLRGLAVKLIGVSGDKVLESEKTAQTQDFLMVNSAIPLADDVNGFVGFAEAAINGPLTLAPFLLTHPKTIGLIATKLARKIHTLTNERYFSAAPVRLGEKAIKYMAFPCRPPEKEAVAADSDNYLKEELALFSATHDICFNFFVQIQSDPDNTPIEHHLIQWSESDAPYLKVAQLILPPQKFDSDKQNQFCDQLAFTVWHALPEHQPLGNMNRARKVAYEKSRRMRMGQKPNVEPTGLEVFD